jgi:hypothetical protein
VPMSAWSASLPLSHWRWGAVSGTMQAVPGPQADPGPMQAVPGPRHEMGPKCPCPPQSRVLARRAAGGAVEM